MTLANIHGKYQIQKGTVDIEKLEPDFLLGSSWKINGTSSVKATITTIPDPVEDEDVVNKRYVDLFLPVLTQIKEIKSNNLGVPGKLSFGINNHINGINNVPNKDINDIFPYITNADITIDIPKFKNTKTISILLNSNIVFNINLEDITNNEITFLNSKIIFSDTSLEILDNGKSVPNSETRTAEIILSKLDMLKGYNSVQIHHENSISNSIEWVFDDDNSIYSSFELGNIFGDIRYLSGVRYYSNVRFELMMKINNLFNYTFSNSSDAIKFHCHNCYIGNEQLSNINHYTDTLDEVKLVSLNVDRLFNQSATIQVEIERLNKPSINSIILVYDEILMDQCEPSSTITYENFDDENFRLKDDLSLDIVLNKWDSFDTLWNNNGLLVSNSNLTYPKNNFSNIKNSPASNVNYEGISGNRTYLRYFNTEIARQNFVLNIDCENVEFVKSHESIYDNRLWIEILAPNSQNQLIWKDLVTPYNGNINDIGCSAQILGDDLPNTIGGTFGTNDTSVTNLLLILRITASEHWNGTISNIALTWL
jgi:hypothetical protein